MSVYRKVETKMWSDSKFCSLSPLPPSGQSLWLFLLTGPHTGPIPGLFKCGRAAMAEELGWSLEAFDEAFQEVFDKGMVKADWKAKVVWIPNAIKYNSSTSPNVITSWSEVWELIPECELKLEAYEALKKASEEKGPAFLKAFTEAIPKPSLKAFGKPSTKPFDMPLVTTSTIQEQEQEQEQDLNSKPMSSKKSLDVSVVEKITLPKNEKPEKQVFSAEIETVFSYWKQKTGHSRAALDGKRRRSIRDRLKNGYTAEDLCQAVDGLLKSDYHMGKNDSGAVFDDIELICRDGKHVDQFLKLAGQQNSNIRHLSQPGRKTAEAGMRWLERKEREHAETGL